MPDRQLSQRKHYWDFKSRLRRGTLGLQGTGLSEITWSRCSPSSRLFLKKKVFFSSVSAPIAVCSCRERWTRVLLRKRWSWQFFYGRRGAWTMLQWVQHFRDQLLWMAAVYDQRAKQQKCIKSAKHPSVVWCWSGCSTNADVHIFWTSAPWGSHCGSTCGTPLVWCWNRYATCIEEHIFWTQAGVQFLHLEH